MSGSTKKDTDTVRAMLTPGEAVLTVAAAERVGRKNIAMLNKTSGKKARKYADGTSDVGASTGYGRGETKFERDIKDWGAKNKLPEFSQDHLNGLMKKRIAAIQRDRTASGAAQSGDTHFELAGLRERLKTTKAPQATKLSTGTAKVANPRKYADGTSDVGGNEFSREQNNFQVSNRVTKSEANSEDFQNAAKAKLQKMDGSAGYAKGTSKVAKPKKTEPAKKPRKYDDGTSKVIKDDYSKEDFADDAQYKSDQNDYKDPTQNKSQGPTPLNLSNMQYAQKNGEKTIWNGPTGKRDTPSYSKGTPKVPQPRMSKVDRVVDRLFKK